MDHSIPKRRDLESAKQLLVVVSKLRGKCQCLGLAARSTLQEGHAIEVACHIYFVISCACLQVDLTADEGIVFLACDYNTRDHALPGWKGALPQADLHNFTGGTFPWVQSRLAAPRHVTNPRYIFLHHQPYRCPDPIPDWRCVDRPSRDLNVWEAFFFVSSCWELCVMYETDVQIMCVRQCVSGLMTPDTLNCT